MLEIVKFPVGLMQSNCYAAYCADSMEAIIIDYGDACQKVFDFVQTNKLDVKYIVATHAHFDHVFGYQYFKKQYPNISLQIHENDKYIWEGNIQYSQLFQIQVPDKYPNQPDSVFTEKDNFLIGSYQIQIILTPGHSPGSCCFYCKEANMLVSDDSLFNGCTGRTDLPGGSQQQMDESIKRLKEEIDPNTSVYPGHGLNCQFGKSVEKMEKGCCGM